MPNYWIIENDVTKSPPHGNRAGDPLDGLQIQQTSTGYQLVAVLSTTDKKAAPFEFHDVPFANETWDLHVEAPLDPNKNGGGEWHMHGKGPMDTGGQDGDFTAQAGSGLGDEPDEAASSAQA